MHSSCLPVAVNKIPNFLANPNSSENAVMPHHRCTIHLNCEQSSMIHEAYLAAQSGGYSKRYSKILKTGTPKIVSVIGLNPIAHRKAKIVYNFGLSECNRVKLEQKMQTEWQTI